MQRAFVCVWCKRPLNWWLRLLNRSYYTEDGLGPLCWRHWKEHNSIIKDKPK